MKPPFTRRFLRSILRYVPDTGLFIWLVNRGRYSKVGSRAGNLNHDGYRYIRVNGVKYSEHRLAWFYMKGTWPKRDIDHENRIKHENWWLNLRIATRTQNQANSRARTAVKGVTQVRTGKWAAQIQKAGRKVHLGTFTTAEFAHAAYAAKAKQLYGRFARVA